MRLPRSPAARSGVTIVFTRPLGAAISATWPPTSSGWTRARRSALNPLGIIPSGQIGVLRTSDREIRILRRYVQSSGSGPGRWFEVVASASIEGGDTLGGRQVSGARRGRVATRATPWPLRRANLGEQLNPVSQGSRRSQRYVHDRPRRAIRIRPTVWLSSAKFSPARLGPPAGQHPRRHRGHREARGRPPVPVELRTLFGTTMTQIARGGPDWPEPGIWGSSHPRKFY